MAEQVLPQTISDIARELGLPSSKINYAVACLDLEPDLRAGPTRLYLRPKVEAIIAFLEGVRRNRPASWERRGVVNV